MSEIYKQKTWVRLKYLYTHKLSVARRRWAVAVPASLRRPGAAGPARADAALVTVRQPPDTARNISPTGATRTRSGSIASSNPSISASSARIASGTSVL